MAQVEPPEIAKPRRPKRERPIGEKCLNCGEETTRKFCPECGQENRAPELTLLAVLRELFAEIAYYDSKMWRTLRMLVTQPGNLSIRWSMGRRASYLSPVRLYLMVTFLFFLATAWRGTKPSINVSEPMTAEQKQNVIRAISSERLTPEQLQMIEDSEAKMKLTPEEQRQFQAAVDQATKNEQNAEMAAGGLSHGESKLGFLHDPDGWFYKRIRQLQTTDENVLAREFISQIPKVLFIILPLFALVLRILYWRQKRTFVEHLVFILHLHSFAFLAFLPSILISTSWMGLLTTLFAFFGLPAYAFVAMLRFYAQPWWLTLLKSWFLGVAYLCLALAGTLLALVLTMANLPDAPPPKSKPLVSSTATSAAKAAPSAAKQVDQVSGP